jgi:hypothetical protein
MGKNNFSVSYPTTLPTPLAGGEGAQMVLGSIFNLTDRKNVPHRRHGFEKLPLYDECTCLPSESWDDVFIRTRNGDAQTFNGVRVRNSTGTSRIIPDCRRKRCRKNVRYYEMIRCPQKSSLFLHSFARNIQNVRSRLIRFLSTDRLITLMLLSCLLPLPAFHTVIDSEIQYICVYARGFRHYSVSTPQHQCVLPRHVSPKYY